jgi:hypothetical protein
MRDVVAKIDGAKTLCIYDARTGRFIRQLNGTCGKYTSASVAGGTVHATRQDGKIDTYDTETGRYLRTI